MALNGIDISWYQRGINIAAVPADFVIVKATEGTWYTNPCFREQADATLSSGKLLGIYHYISGGNWQAEAQYFVNTVKDYVGRAVLALDFESGDNSAYDDTAYLQQCAQTVYNLTGVHPLLYGSQRDYGRLAAVGKATNCGLWIAQYANNNHTGYQNNPWNEDAYDCAIRQYSSAGALPNYGDNLDLNKFYGDRDAWQSYARSDRQPQPQEEQQTEQSMPAISEITHDGDISTVYVHIPWSVQQDIRMAVVRVGNVVTVNGCGGMSAGDAQWAKANEYIPEGFRPTSLAAITLTGGRAALLVQPDGSIYYDGDARDCTTHLSGAWVTNDNQPE